MNEGVAVAVTLVCARQRPPQFRLRPYTLAGRARARPQLEGAWWPRHYQVLSLLGAGGMGEVYLARDSRLDRTVALKILPGELAADPERMQRFAREAKAASALNHPNVATIYDVGESDGIRFIVMEHVEGETIAAENRPSDGTVGSCRYRRAGRGRVGRRSRQGHHAP